MNSRVTAKRYACDRCREQKLRCPRNEPGDIHSTCGRCLRLGTLCVTGGGRPLGRPSAAPNLQSSGMNRASKHAYDHADRAPVPSPQLSMHHDDFPLGPPAGPFFSPTHHHAPPAFDALHDLQLEGSAMTFSMEPFNPPPSAASHHSRGSSLSTPQQEEQFSPDSSPASVSDFDFSSLGDGSIPDSVLSSYPHNSAGCGPPDCQSSNPGPLLPQVKRGGGVPGSPMGGDVIAFLIGLVGNITRQLAELRNQDWESWDPCLTQSSLFDSDGRRPSHSSGQESLDPNPWDTTLNITTRFAVILQTMVPVGGSAPGPAVFSAPTLSIKLMLLSTYIQLGDLYDQMIIHIHNCLLLHQKQQQEQQQQQQQQPNNQEENQNAAQAKPTKRQQRQPRQQAQASSRSRYTHRPGTAPANDSTNIHVAMMIQVFEHQLHAVERLMGLPAECQLWSTGNGGRKDMYYHNPHHQHHHHQHHHSPSCSSSPGIMDQGEGGGESSVVLTQAAMSQAQETFRSLKWNIERIWRVLRA
ncbi:hypothetical protein MFIFM68171_09810 [Madurella fahalii]|uniref:Zn(2)-C6 fungal-type domain-containing protein n=1 Tax=Madurella fahalii TaxID=1157608 RepID=A0ABQ0GPD9_9PEZI